MRKAKIFSALLLLVPLANNSVLAESSSGSKHKTSSKHTASTHATSKKHTGTKSGSSKSGSSKHHYYARRHRANRSQGPTVEQVPQEIFPPGHKFTPEEKAEASQIGAMVENRLWKDAFKAATAAGKQSREGRSGRAAAYDQAVSVRDWTIASRNSARARSWQK